MGTAELLAHEDSDQTSALRHDKTLAQLLTALRPCPQDNPNPGGKKTTASRIYCLFQQITDKPLNPLQSIY